MGQEISQSAFEPADFERFDAQLRAETRLLGDLAARGQLSDDGYVIGFEVEAWLLDHAFFPNPDNERFLETLAHPLVVPELSRFNVELNCDPLPMTGTALSRAARSLAELWDHCNRQAHGLDANMLMIGTLPNIRESDLTLENMSPLKRYSALNHEILRWRNGRPIVLDIEGRDRLRSEHADIMLEAAATSFQIHLKTPAQLAHRYYNASIMASAPLLAAAGNAPFLFGRSLWEETRIPIFEQAISLAGSAPQGRVTFGSGYAESSLAEVFAENLEVYPLLLPLLTDEPAERFQHLRLHNGTIWRWNRPLIGFEADGTPHFRVEHRTLPSGPTILDMIANAAVYAGFVRDMVDRGHDETSDLSFDDARANFYAAARFGLDAELDWPETGRVTARDLVLDSVIPAAHRGLGAFGIDADDRDFFLGIVKARVRGGQTGAAWQRAMHARVDGDAFRLISAYCENQRGGVPVHQWPL